MEETGMHEFHIAKNIAEEIRRRAAKLAQVRQVDVQIGALLRFDATMCAELLAQMLKEPRFEDTVFNVAVLPAAARCAACGAEFEPAPDVPQCPKCESLKAEIISGKDWKVTSVK
jgi:Zn finger protein HypA/HybF involved in hydrogenase expression